METGSYNGRRVDFSVYAVTRFAPHIFPHFKYAKYGCGATALALLTGVAPEAVRPRRRGGHFSDSFLLRFLRCRGYSIRQLTRCNLSLQSHGVRHDHVVLLSQLVRRNEGTWGVLFNNSFYHNFMIFSADVLTLLNKPTLSAYLVIHPSWRNPYGCNEAQNRPQTSNQSCRKNAE